MKVVHSPEAKRLRPTDLVRFGSVVGQLRDWAELCDVSVASLRYRMSQGLTVLDALTRPYWGHATSLPWEQDIAARRFVAARPDGGTLDEIGDFFGISKERVRQIETAALGKLLRHAPPEWESHIAEILSQRWEGEAA